MGMDRDLSTRPLVFDARGFLVAILKDEDEARRASAQLVAGRFAPEEFRVYSAQEILEDHERYLAQRSAPRRLVAALTDDKHDIELYFAFAAEGCSALWVHVPTREDASRAIRNLDGYAVRHYRYFGHGGYFKGDRGQEMPLAHGSDHD
jgi:hypothetical protein